MSKYHNDMADYFSTLLICRVGEPLPMGHETYEHFYISIILSEEERVDYKGKQWHNDVQAEDNACEPTRSKWMDPCLRELAEMVNRMARDPVRFIPLPLVQNYPVPSGVQQTICQSGGVFFRHTVQYDAFGKWTQAEGYKCEKCRDGFVPRMITPRGIRHTLDLQVA